MRPLSLPLALLCAIAPAHAGTPGQDLFLPLGGPSHYPGASADYNFALALSLVLGKLEMDK